MNYEQLDRDFDKLLSEFTEQQLQEWIELDQARLSKNMNEYKVTINLLGHVYKTTIKAPDEISARQRVLTALVNKISEGMTVEQVGDDLSSLKSIFKFN